MATTSHAPAEDRPGHTNHGPAEYRQEDTKRGPKNRWGILVKDPGINGAQVFTDP